MSTTTIAPTLQSELDKGRVEQIADIIRLIKLGTMLTPLKRVFTGLTGAATYNLTALDASGETAGAANPNRLPIQTLLNLRVVTATTAASEGAYITTDIGGNTVSPATHTAVGVALISDDGSTLTFPTTDVTAFTIEYLPQAAVAMDSLPSGSGIGTTP